MRIRIVTVSVPEKSDYEPCAEGYVCEAHDCYNRANVEISEDLQTWEKVPDWLSINVFLCDDCHFLGAFLNIERWALKR